MEVLFLILVVIAGVATSALSQYIEERFPNYPLRQPFGFLLLIFLGAFGVGVFLLLLWILEWINF